MTQINGINDVARPKRARFIVVLEGAAGVNTIHQLRDVLDFPPPADLALMDFRRPETTWRRCVEGGLQGARAQLAADDSMRWSIPK
jgi:hypothetical protein